MSKKKKRNQENRRSTQIEYEADDLNRAIKAGRLAYLKKHWRIVGIIVFLTIGALGAGLKYIEEKRSNGNQNKLTSSVNLPASMPNPTPQLSKEYIYAGSKLLAVEDANANVAPPADLAVWRPSSGVWWVMGGTYSQSATQAWGTNGDQTAPGDYDGDGKTDFCIFRPSTNSWWIMRSSDNFYYSAGYGTNGDKPVPGDYDGDGKTDIAVFRASTGVWYIQHSSTGNNVTSQLGTGSEFIPTPADFDGDGRSDVSVWSNNSGIFYTIKTADNPNQQYTQVQYGQTGDKPICADYDGDGKADLAVWRVNTWYILQSSNNQTIQYQWGNTAWDEAVQNDYDGDGKVDIAVWRGFESTQGAGDVGKWFIRNSSTGQARIEQWGIAGDKPVPAFYRR